jgi:hypothetical protein
MMGPIEPPPPVVVSVGPRPPELPPVEQAKKTPIPVNMARQAREVVLIVEPTEGRI